MDKARQLEKWAEKALAYYNEIAPKIDLSFYQFQKPVDFSNPTCELLIIGLNPGWNKMWKACFEAQYENKAWKFEGKKMPMEVFTAGNPWFSVKKSWRIINGLKALGLSEQLNDCRNWQYMNYIPFATTDFKGYLKRDKEKETHTFDECRKLTLEYIECLRPKRILILGTSNGVDNFPTDSEPQVLLQGNQRYIISMKIAGIPTIAIPHPSRYRQWPAEIIAAMSDMLRRSFSEEAIEFAAGRERP